MQRLFFFPLPSSLCRRLFSPDKQVRIAGNGRVFFFLLSADFTLSLSISVREAVRVRGLRSLFEREMPRVHYRAYWFFARAYSDGEVIWRSSFAVIKFRASCKIDLIFFTAVLCQWRFNYFLIPPRFRFLCRFILIIRPCTSVEFVFARERLISLRRVRYIGMYPQCDR